MTPRQTALVATIFCTAALLDGCNSSSSNNTVSSFIAIGSGTNLLSYTLDANSNPAQISSAAIPSGSLLGGHAIFDIKKHPTKNLLYVASLNECSDASTSWCWGNARIDRFSYNSAGKLTHDGAAFTYTNGSGPACADVASGNTGQVGVCAPTNIAFSPDGSRLYVDDDADDLVQIFSVDSTSGDLTYIWEGDSTSMNSMVVSQDGNYLYTGTNVHTLSSDTSSTTTSGNNGNETEIVSNGTGYVLTTTIGSNGLGIYDLSTPTAPAQIALNSTLGSGNAVSQAASSDLSRFVTVGHNTVTSVSFDGASTLTQDDQYVISEAINTVNRDVAVTENGDYAIVAWFRPYDDVGNALLDGGISVYAIDSSTGALTQVISTNLGAVSRAVRLIQQ